MKAAALLASLLVLWSLPGMALAEDRLLLATEPYPPLSYLDADGNFKGAAVDQVETMMRNAGIAYTLEILPWARAIATAEVRDGHCVFTTARTSERENRFKWVGPLNSSRNHLVTSSDSKRTPQDLEEAKFYTIGTHRGDYSESLLREAGFAAIDLSADFDATLRKLLDHRIDLMPMSALVFDRMVRNGVPIKSSLTFAKQDFDLACHKDVSDHIILKLQTSLDRMQADGTNDEIYHRYGLPSPR